MSWLDLLFMHWPVAPHILRPFVPAALELDTFDGQAWLGVVPFYMTNVRPRAFPEGFASAFPEINVRTYVRFKERSGVWFFSLDAANRAAVWGARRFFHLPYWLAAMQCSRRDDVVYFESRRREDKRVQIACQYKATGAPFHAAPGTLEHFLTERYCLFSANSRELFCGEIDHKLWSLQPAEAEVGINNMTNPFGVAIHSKPLLHFAARQDVVAWSLDALHRA